MKLCLFTGIVIFMVLNNSTCVQVNNAIKNNSQTLTSNKDKSSSLNSNTNKVENKVENTSQVKTENKVTSNNKNENTNQAENNLTNNVSSTGTATTNTNSENTNELTFFSSSENFGKEHPTILDSVIIKRSVHISNPNSNNKKDVPQEKGMENFEVPEIRHSETNNQQNNKKTELDIFEKKTVNKDELLSKFKHLIEEGLNK